MSSYPIFFEYLLQPSPADAIIFFDGFPSRYYKDDVLFFLYSKGYHVFFPRYRGTYQSGGKFLQTNVVSDFSRFMKKLNKGRVKNLWDGKTERFKIKRNILLANSFGGTLALGLAAKTKRFSHLILVATWDFEEDHNTKPITMFTKRAFKNLYRFDFDDVKPSLKRMKELSKSYYTSRLDIPILAFHNPEDKTVPISHTRGLARRVKNVKVIEHRFGHPITRDLLKAVDKDIERFLKKK
jgi:pimeloyl-ACP methyl ester carboxylesterase